MGGGRIENDVSVVLLYRVRNRFRFEIDRFSIAFEDILLVFLKDESRREGTKTSKGRTSSRRWSMIWLVVSSVHLLIIHSKGHD